MHLTGSRIPLCFTYATALCACLSTPQRPAPQDPQIVCDSTDEGKLSPGGEFPASTLAGPPIATDLTGDGRDDLILWGQETVGDVTCSRVWIFDGNPARISLQRYDRRINFATAIRAVSIATISSGTTLDVVVLVQREGGVALARYSSPDSVMAPLFPLPSNIGDGPYTLFGTEPRKVYVGGLSAHYEVDFAGQEPMLMQFQEFVPEWRNMLAAAFEPAQTVVAAFKTKAVRGHRGSLDNNDNVNDFGDSMIDGFTFARPVDMGLLPNFLYGVGISSTSSTILFLREGAAVKLVPSIRSLDDDYRGIAVAAAKVEEGDHNATATAAAVLARHPDTAMLRLDLYEFKVETLSRRARLDDVTIPAGHIAAGKFRNRSRDGAGEVFVLATDPPSSLCFTIGDSMFKPCI